MGEASAYEGNRSGTPQLAVLAGKGESRDHHEIRERSLWAVVMGAKEIRQEGPR